MFGGESLSGLKEFSRSLRFPSGILELETPFVVGISIGDLTALQDCISVVRENKLNRINLKG